MVKPTNTGKEVDEAEWLGQRASLEQVRERSANGF
jgi:hypothetical protein